MTTEIDISVLDPKWETALPTLDDVATQIVSEALCQAGAPQRFPGMPIEVSILFANNDVVQDLNNRYRGKDKPTNVLSFAQMDGEDTPGAPVASLGDIALAYETITAEAAEQHKSIEDHTKHLLIHGALHLLGYDHENDEDAAEMESLEIKILSTFGIKNPYEFRDKTH